MKRLFLLLGSFIFILTGCSDPGTVDYYLSNGYTDLGEVGYGYTYEDVYDETSFLMEKEISANEKVTIMYDNDKVFVFEGSYTIDGINIIFQTRTTDEHRSCYAYDENTMYTHEELSCSATYAYYLENAPDLAAEIVALNDDFILSSDLFSGGDITEVEEVIAYLQTDRTTTDFYLDTGYTDQGTYLEKQINENEVVKIYYENDAIYGLTADYTTGNVVVSFMYNINDQDYTCSAYNVTAEDSTIEDINCADVYNYFMINTESLQNEAEYILHNFEIQDEELYSGDAAQIEKIVTDLENL